MKHFTSAVSLSNSFELDVTEPFTGYGFLRVQQALVVAMDANPESMSSSQERVLTDFIGWFARAKEDDTLGCSFAEPIFCYVNISTGFSLVVVMTDAKGKIDFCKH